MRYLLWQEISSCLNEVDREMSRFKNGDVPDLFDVHKKFSHMIEQLKLSLESKLDNQHASLMIFALVASLDEEMQGISTKKRWNPLQVLFYSVHTGGEVFFKMIDDFLDDKTIPLIVYEIYYLMLKRGFQGRFRNSKTQLDKYNEMLITKIATAKTATDSNSSVFDNKFRIDPTFYYGCSVALGLMMYLFLILFSHFGA